MKINFDKFKHIFRSNYGYDFSYQGLDQIFIIFVGRLDWGTIYSKP